jgi:hypothetical protein
LIDPVIFPKKLLWRIAAMKILGLRSVILKFLRKQNGR